MSVLPSPWFGHLRLGAQTPNEGINCPVSVRQQWTRDLSVERALLRFLEPSSHVRRDVEEKISSWRQQQQPRDRRRR